MENDLTEARQKFHNVWWDLANPVYLFSLRETMGRVPWNATITGTPIQCSNDAQERNNVGCSDLSIFGVTMAKKYYEASKNLPLDLRKLHPFLLADLQQCLLQKMSQ